MSKKIFLFRTLSPNLVTTYRALGDIAYVSPDDTTYFTRVYDEVGRRVSLWDLAVKYDEIILMGVRSHHPFFENPGVCKLHKKEVTIVHEGGIKKISNIHHP